MLLPVAIPSMTAFPEARPVREHVLLAQMTVELGPLLVTGCALARMERGEFKVWFPNLGRDRRIVIRDRAERERILAVALTAYRVLTGRDPADTPVAKASPKADTFHDPE